MTLPAHPAVVKNVIPRRAELVRQAAREFATPIGPAGHLLRAAMHEAGLDPDQTWLTNAVKHFKFTPRGKARLHQNPNRGEIVHCRWWLGLELGFIQPQISLALGASAAFALTNNHRPISQRRGHIETGLHGGPVLISWHPAHILRTTDPVLQAELRKELVADLSMLPVRAVGTSPTALHNGDE